jgi:hypothetical protein
LEDKSFLFLRLNSWTKWLTRRLTKSSAQVSVTCGGLEDTLNGQERHIKGSSSEIEDENVTLAADLIETVGDGSSSGLVDDTEDVHARNGTGILGGLTLQIIKVRRDGDNRIVAGCAEVRFCGYRITN